MKKSMMNYGVLCVEEEDRYRKGLLCVNCITFYV